MATGLTTIDKALPQDLDLDELIRKRSKDVPWYHPSPDHLSETAKEVLRNYSGIADEEIAPHVQRVRDSAWEVHPYPCLGGFRFLDFSIHQNPYYSTLLERLRNGAVLLDLGCCFAQDLRRVLYDGIPAKQLAGADLEGSFIDLGYELFRDKERTSDLQFFRDINIFNVETLQGLLKSRGKKFDVVHIAAFLHLFDYQGQLTAARNIVKYLLADDENAVIIGRQAGAKVAAEYTHRTNKGGSMYRHNSESLKKFWQEVGDFEAEIQEGQWEGGKDPVFGSEGSLRLIFVVRRRKTV